MKNGVASTMSKKEPHELTVARRDTASKVRTFIIGFKAKKNDLGNDAISMSAIMSGITNMRS